MNLHNIRIVLLLLFLAFSMDANPIVVDPEIADAVKSSEDLSIYVEEDYSTISGKFTYCRIPDLRSDTREVESLKYIKIVVPVYRHESPEKRIAKAGVEIRCEDQVYESEELWIYGWQQSRDGSQNQVDKWIVPEGYEVALYAAKIPIALIEEHRVIEIAYAQDHVYIKGRPYLYYTPLFENGKVWEYLKKSLMDFCIWINTSPTVSFKIDPLKCGFQTYGQRDRGYLVLPENLKHIKILLKISEDGDGD